MERESLLVRVQRTIEDEWVQVTREQAAAIFAEKIQPEGGWHSILCQEYLYEEPFTLDGAKYLISYLTWTVILWRFDGLVAFREVRVGWDEPENNFMVIIPRAPARTEAVTGTIRTTKRRVRSRDE